MRTVRTPLQPDALLDLEVQAPTLRDSLRRVGQSLANAARELYKSKTAFIGAIMLAILFTACLLTPYIDRYSPVKQNYRELLQPPSAKHFFGTDRYGRDIWSRVLWGGRRLITISLLAVSLGLVLGVPFGALSGYYGGWIDTVAMRLVDAWLAFPGLLFYLILITIAREWKLEGVWNDAALVFALGVAQVPRLARLVRGTVLAEKEKEYVEASRVIGESDLYIALRQILPNCLSPVIVQATVSLGFILLVVAALSFLGLGSPPPTPDWGADLNLARDHMETRPYVAIFPGLAISYAVLAFNLFGDGLRDILDPRTVER
ncbi:MAG: peptide ABC transporter substrate-binding protein [Candidatus Tectimicrobiota bacterium]|nr:MAG: peptide ABC transporter substrate-binding protein [Candidatus Tectomicrobia bacterium]